MFQFLFFTLFFKIYVCVGGWGVGWGCIAHVIIFVVFSSPPSPPPPCLSSFVFHSSYYLKSVCVCVCACTHVCFHAHMHACIHVCVFRWFVGKFSCILCIIPVCSLLDFALAIFIFLFRSPFSPSPFCFFHSNRHDTDLITHIVSFPQRCGPLCDQTPGRLPSQELQQGILAAAHFLFGARHAHRSRGCPQVLLFIP